VEGIRRCRNPGIHPELDVDGKPLLQRPFLGRHTDYSDAVNLGNKDSILL
jgi:hypothetical protein